MKNSCQSFNSVLSSCDQMVSVYRKQFNQGCFGLVWFGLDFFPNCFGVLTFIYSYPE